MNITKNILLSGATIIAFSSCATSISNDRNAPTGDPVATVQFEAKNAAYWLSVAGGNGTLEFQGKSYPISVVDTGVGGTGFQTLSAKGDVYNLTKIEDFPGRYTGARSGITLFKGKQCTKITNSKGVVIYVEAKTTGVASSTGASTVTIELK